MNHNINNLFLTSDFGRSLTYHGELAGLPWPTSVSLAEREDMGIITPGKDELYNGRYFTIRTHAKLIRYIPDYFIITDFEELERQPDLKKFLNANYPVLAKSDDFMIFDLNKMRSAENN
ncbi:MAG: hypothetical protein HY758_03685 [Nitrospirae bacterium]|nr:hypothetical protein [Nitrospirota bacterium]